MCHAFSLLFAFIDVCRQGECCPEKLRSGISAVGSHKTKACRTCCQTRTKKPLLCERNFLRLLTATRCCVTRNCASCYVTLSPVRYTCSRGTNQGQGRCSSFDRYNFTLDKLSCIGNPSVRTTSFVIADIRLSDANSSHVAQTYGGRCIYPLRQKKFDPSDVSHMQSSVAPVVATRLSIAAIYNACKVCLPSIAQYS